MLLRTPLRHLRDAVLLVVGGQLVGGQRQEYLEVFRVHADVLRRAVVGLVHLAQAAVVLSDSGEAVAGLYAAGDVCGSIEEKDGRPYAMGFDAAMNYGYLMAETVKGEI